MEGIIYIRRGLCTEGNLLFKIDWVSLQWEGNLPFLLLLYFVFESKLQVQAPQRAYIRSGDLTEGCLRYDFGGLLFEGDYTWRGLFSEFYGSLRRINFTLHECFGHGLCLVNE